MHSVCVQIESETPDAWLGLLREPKQGNDPLGPTLKAIMIEHFGRVFFGPEGNFWRDDTDLMQLVRMSPFRSVHLMLQSPFEPPPNPGSDTIAADIAVILVVERSLRCCPALGGPFCWWLSSSCLLYTSPSPRD